MTLKESANKKQEIGSQGQRRKMEAIGSGGGGANGDGTRWGWWALLSTAQLVWGVSSFRKGCAGDGSLMPFKAFAVASLFVGSAASASFAALKASGIHKVEDLVKVGKNMRTGLGIPPRVREE